MKICGIYKITSPSGNIYIGQSEDIIFRMSYYRHSIRMNQPRLCKSIRKYGFDSHSVEIIKTCTKEQLNYFEKYFIEYYDTFNTDHGMNMTPGGDSKIAFSDATINRISGKNSCHYKPVSQEDIIKISKMYNSGNSVRQISKIIGLEWKKVKFELSNLGIKLRSPREQCLIENQRINSERLSMVF